MPPLFSPARLVSLPRRPLLLVVLLRAVSAHCGLELLERAPVAVGVEHGRLADLPRAA